MKFPMQCVVSAACLAASVLAQSPAPAVGGGIAVATQDPAPASSPSREQMQVRLAEVLSILEEDDLTDEQRAKARAKLHEIMERLAKEQAVGQAARGGERPARFRVVSPEGTIAEREGVRVYGSGGRAIVVTPEAEECEVLELEAVGGDAPLAKQRVRTLLRGGAPATAPTPPKAPKAPKPPKAPRAPAADGADETSPTLLRLMEVHEAAAVEDERVLVMERQRAAAARKHAEDARRHVEAAKAIDKERRLLLRTPDAAPSPIEVHTREAREPGEEDDVRAMIDEMRAEMREIRDLIRQLRERSARRDGPGIGAGGAPGVLFGAGGAAVGTSGAAASGR